MSKRALPEVFVSSSPCPRCGGQVKSLDAPSYMGYRVRFCACQRGYAAKDVESFGTSYCISIDCPCRPAGRSAGHGALTGRARWFVSAPGAQDPGSSDLSLCGSCYRAIKDVLA